MPSLRDRFQRWPRPWRRAVGIVLALYALYLLAGNLYLNTPLFDASTNRQPHKFTMQTGPAVTLFPGEVIAWNVPPDCRGCMSCGAAASAEHLLMLHGASPTGNHGEAARAWSAVSVARGASLIRRYAPPWSMGKDLAAGTCVGAASVGNCAGNDVGVR